MDEPKQAPLGKSKEDPIDIPSLSQKRDPVPPDLPHHVLTSQGGWTDAKTIRRMRRESDIHEAYRKLVAEHKEMWQDFADMVEARKKAEQAAYEVILNRQRTQHQTATLAAEEALKRLEKSNHEKAIAENEQALTKLKKFDELELEEKRLKNVQLQAQIATIEAQNTLIKPKDGDGRKQTIDPFIREILRKVTDMDKVEQARQFIKSLLPPEVAEEVDVLCEEKIEQIRKRGVQ
jgi:primosomal protein N'